MLIVWSPTLPRSCAIALRVKECAGKLL